MRGRYQVDIMTSQVILKIEHLLGQPVIVSFIELLGIRVLADLEVLTVDAAHVAVAQKDGAGPPHTGKGRFFPMMGTAGGYCRTAAGAAESPLIL